MNELTIQLRPLPSDVPPEVRVRRLLKYAKRVLALKCVCIEPSSTSDAQA